MSELIKVENLYHTYTGNVEALKGINLIINEGEFVALIGQNGSGKTTLAKHLNGLLKPTKGTVYVKGVDTRNYSLSKLSSMVGYVFQNPDHMLFSELNDGSTCNLPYFLGKTSDISCYNIVPVF